jgi:hypothetical protein
MVQLVRRDYPRIRHHAAIKYAPENIMAFRTARMHNYSVGGLCFASDQALASRSELSIVMSDYHLDRFGPASFRFYRARVQWIHPMVKTGRDGFAVGAQFIGHGHYLPDYDDDTQLHMCDLCASLTPNDQINCATADICLCPHCAAQMKHLPEGSVRKCLERFFAGNVV